MEKYLFIALTLGLTAYGQLVVKARAIAHGASASASKLDYLIAMYTDLRVLSALGAAVLASVCWALALEKAGLAFAYPFMALSFVIVPLGAKLLFAETIVPMQVVGIGFILTGVVLIALNASS